MTRNFKDSRGFATIAAAIIVLVVLAVGGGAYYASDRAEKRANPDANATTTADANVKGSTSLRALAGMNQNLTCTFTDNEGGRTNSGVVYVAAGRMRGDFTSESAADGKVTSHMVNDGQYTYIWSDAMAGQGIKVKTEASASATAQSQGGVDWNDQVDYDCDTWNVDSSKFTLPSGMTFLDLGAAMNAGAGTSSAAANANVNANLGAGAANAGVDVRGLINSY